MSIEARASLTIRTGGGGSTDPVIRGGSIKINQDLNCKEVTCNLLG